jgi:Protein of unknown function (DUF3460)
LNESFFSTSGETGFNFDTREQNHSLLTLDGHMPFFRRPDYKSETSQFIDQLKSANPQLESQQRQGRLLLWDQPMNSQLWDEFAKGTVPQKPYVYQTNA